MRSKEKIIMARQLSFCTNQEWLRTYNVETRPPFDLEMRKRNLLEVKEVLDSVGLKFWLTNGTALAAYRDQDWIPWDDDVDLDVMMEDFLPKHDAIKELLIDRGFVVRSKNIDNPKIAKVAVFRSENPLSGQKLALRPLYLDPSYEDNKYRLRQDYKYPKMFYENENASTIEFMGETFNIPSPPEKFIEYAYGKNWNVPNKSDHEHQYSPIWIRRSGISAPNSLVLNEEKE
jgi:hypothetical protein